MKQQKGYIHIYYGQGKGKTSILNGMTIRALGHQWKIAYFRFLKNRPTGELMFFEKNCNFKIYDFYHSSQKFVWDMNEKEVEEMKTETIAGVELLEKKLQDNTYDLIVVDEILGCLENKFIDVKKIVQILENRMNNIEVVLTGRVLPPELLQIADLVSEIKPVKHYFEQKVMAREGIEY